MARAAKLPKVPSVYASRVQGQVRLNKQQKISKKKMKAPHRNIRNLKRKIKRCAKSQFVAT